MSKVTGNIKQLVAQGVSVNGKALDAVTLGMLTRLPGYANKVGTEPRPEGTKGKPANIWEVEQNATLA